MEEREVKLSQDHLQRQAQCSAERAIEELIWNGLDAGDHLVAVHFEMNELGAVTAIEVADQGTGIAFDDLERAFGTIGRSLKLEWKVTRDGRVLHGTEGRGRFRALVLGQRARWCTTYARDGALLTYEIEIDRGTQERYQTSAPQRSAATATGTVLRIEGVDNGERSLPADKTLRYLTERLGLYLTNYPHVGVTFDGRSIDPRQVIKNLATYTLGPVREGGETATLEVIEWTFEPEAKKLLICDQQGFVCYETLAGVHARGIQYCAYVRCAEAREWNQAGMFGVAELNSEISGLIERAKVKLRDHVRQRLAEEAQEVVKQWKDEKIYPFGEDEPDTPLRRAERQMFDIVASRVHMYHAPFRDSDVKARQFTLHLVRQALETNPTSLRRIFEKVLKLPREQQDELADLFERIGVEAMMAAAKEVERRLRAIAGFETILFHEDWKKTLRERTQLHRLLVHHLWIFGDEYTLDADDERLRVVLEKHIKHLGREEITPAVDVKLLDGKEGIPDLMLSRQFKRDSKCLEHVIVELKRPSTRLGAEEISQIKKYAYAVSADERFAKEYTHWTFLLVGNDFDEYGEREARGTGLPYGCIAKDGDLAVWIKRWSTVLHEAKSRYEFFRERLDLEATSDEGLAYLQEHYSALMTGKGLTKKQERELAVVP